MMTQETKKKSHFRRNLFLLFIAVFSALFQAGSMQTVSQQEADEFVKVVGEQIKGIDAIGIFSHNALFALIMMIPGGFIFGGIIAFQTGWAVSAATVISPELAQMPALSLLFISPFGLMEITAYAIAMSRSVILVQTLVNRTIRTQLKSTLKEIGIVIGLLLAGGFLEYAMIQWAIENGYNLVEMMS